MSKIRRGGLIFVSWIGDHGHHVHVYRDGRQVLKWDLEEDKPMKGKPTRKILKLIRELKKEGSL